MLLYNIEVNNIRLKEIWFVYLKGKVFFSYILFAGDISSLYSVFIVILVLQKVVFFLKGWCT